jgi:hypothetical protein
MSLLLATTLFALQAAPTPVDIADAKCIGAMSMLEGQASAADKPGLQMAMMFFLGKIYGRSGKGVFDPAMKAAVEQIKATGGADALSAIAEQCATEFSAASGDK